MPFISIKANQSGLAWRKTHNGIEYLIAPFVAVVEGVMNGELVPAEELLKFPQAWNGRTVVINHPEEDGEHISANTPDILSQAPGQLFNAAFNDNKLAFEVWLDVAKITALGGEALSAMERLERGELIEGSAAWFRDVEVTSGEFNGQPYTGIARNIRPDHYALLPNAVGACSIDDGCGGPRVNAHNSDGVFVGFFLASEDANALALSPADLPNGSEITPPGEMHLTLAYLGKIDEMPQGEDVALRFLANFIVDMPIVRGTVDGLGRFSTDAGDGLQPLYASFDSPLLDSWRRLLVYWFEDGFPISRKHGFTPHVTLAHVPAGEAVNIPLPEPREITFDSVALAWGGRVTVFKLQGEVLEIMENKESKGVKRLLVNIAKKLGINFSEKETDMPKKEELIVALVANELCELDKAQLEPLSEEVLSVLDEKLKEPEKPPPADPPATKANGDGDGNTITTALALPPEVADFTTMIEDLGGIENVKVIIQNNVAANTQERERLIAEITEHSSLTTNELAEISDDDVLRKMAQDFRPATYARPAPRADDVDWQSWEDSQAEREGGTE